MDETKYRVLLVLIGFLVFFNSLFNGFVWDDEEQVIKNNFVHSITNLPTFFTSSTFNTGGSGNMSGLYYKPIMSLSFASLYTIFGSHAFFFHLFQLVIHILNTCLVFALFKLFFNKHLSFFLALIFLIHPINAETVVYISSLQDVLFLFFGMIAFWLLRKDQDNLKNLVVVSILLLASLLSKETGILFLPVVFFYLLLFEKGNLKISSLIFLGSLAFYSLLRFVVAKVGFIKSSLSPIAKASFMERLINIPQIIYYYLKTFFFPKDLIIAQHWLIQNINFNNFFLPLILVSLFFLLLLLFAYYLYQNDYKKFKIFLFFSFWFVTGLGLHIQLFPLDMTVAERWFYFPLIGLLGMFGVILLKILQFWPELKKGLLIVGAVLVILLSARTFIRNFDWKDGLTIYSHDITLSHSFDLENNLGVELYRSGKIEESAKYFQNSVDLAPYWWTNWNNLGVIYEHHQDFQKALDSYQKAIDNGHYYLAYENKARLLLTSESTASARDFAIKSLETLPQNPKLWLILAIAEYQIGDKTVALKAASQAYSLMPNQQTYYVYSRIEKGLPLDIRNE